MPARGAGSRTALASSVECWPPSQQETNRANVKRTATPAPMLDLWSCPCARLVWSLNNQKRLSSDHRLLNTGPLSRYDGFRRLACEIEGKQWKEHAYTPRWYTHNMRVRGCLFAGPKTRIDRRTEPWVCRYCTWTRSIPTRNMSKPTQRCGQKLVSVGVRFGFEPTVGHSISSSGILKALLLRSTACRVYAAVQFICRFCLSDLLAIGAYVGQRGELPHRWKCCCFLLFLY